MQTKAIFFNGKQTNFSSKVAKNESFNNFAFKE
jgi:hypothetical protein